MFIAGMSNLLEPPVNDIWTIPGEEMLLNNWITQDSAFFRSIDSTVFYMERQIQDFIDAIKENREPLVNGSEGRKTVELFTAIYRSTRDNTPIKFPLKPEPGRNDFDGRVIKGN